MTRQPAVDGPAVDGRTGVFEIVLANRDTLRSLNQAPDGCGVEELRTSVRVTRHRTAQKFRQFVAAQPKLADAFGVSLPPP
ncbi:MAG: hypothetical protein WD049_04170 [Candidatus Paceibacterota bacterium]